MGKITRKDFLKVSGATIVGGMAAYSSFPTLEAQAKSTGGKKEEVIPTICEVCFWKCGINVHKRDGVPYKISGNPKNPLSNGKLCPRGTGGLGMLQDPDRLKKPLLRVKKDGKDMWKPVSWDEALEYTAKRLLELREKHGPEQLGFFSHGMGGFWFKNLIKQYGSGNSAHPSFDQCRGPRMEGFGLTYGDTPGNPERLDFRNAKCVAFIGSHLGENMHNTQVQDMSVANANGATFITVDPRQSVIATKSQYWLPIKPGTDTALLLAWANVMITEGIYNKSFIQKNASGFDKFAKHVKQYTPEWAAKETDLDAEVIKKTARELAKAAPAAFIHPGRHVVWYGDDTQRSRLIALVNALLGNWLQKGGFNGHSQLKVPKGMKIPKPPKGKVLHNSIMDEYNKVSHHVRSQGIVDASVPMKNEPYIRSWFVYSSNLITTLGNTARTAKIMQGLEFSVVVETMPAEITGYADVVLPEATYLERYDNLHTPMFRQPFVGLRQPVVEPMYDSKPGSWIAKKLAEKMDKVLVSQGKPAEFSQYYPWKDGEAYVKARLDAAGMWKYMKKNGVYVGETAKMYVDPNKLKFDTPSKKIEFYSSHLAEHKLDPMPVYKKHPEPKKDEFRILTGRAPQHTFTRTTNNRRLLKQFPENVLWLNADIAASKGISDGDNVKLVNQDGSKAGPIKVKVTQRIRKDCVFMVHGFGREDKRITASYGKGINDNRIITNISMDPVMGGTGFKNNFVKIVKS